jgi:hypothetical protein
MKLCAPQLSELFETSNLTAFTLAGSDPRAGTTPSALTHTAILTATSLYYLTYSFQSAGSIYAQNPNASVADYVKPPTDAPMFFSLFEYNIGFWPREYVAKVGNLVSYKGSSARCWKQKATDFYQRAQLWRTFCGSR